VQVVAAVIAASVWCRTLRAMVRLATWLVLVAACLGIGGCVDSILGVMLAPEAVVAGAAGQVAQAGADTLAGAGLDNLANTTQAIQDVDRILHNTSDPAAQERLSALRDKLVENQKASAGDSPLSSVTHQDPVFLLRRPRDGMNGARPVSPRDQLTVDPPGVSDMRRPPGRPDVLAENASLKPDVPHGITVSLQPVRINR
jgi:hypothetical protein